MNIQWGLYVGYVVGLHSAQDLQNSVLRINMVNIEEKQKD